MILTLPGVIETINSQAHPETMRKYQAIESILVDIVEMQQSYDPQRFLNFGGALHSFRNMNPRPDSNLLNDLNELLELRNKLAHKGQLTIDSFVDADEAYDFLENVLVKAINLSIDLQPKLESIKAGLEV